MKNSRQGWRKIFYVFLLCLWVAAVVIGVQLAIGIPLVMLAPSFIESTIGNAIYSAVSYILAILLILWGTPKIGGLFGKKSTAISRERIGLKDLPTWTDLGLAPIGYIASIAIAAGLTVLFELMPWFNSSEAQELGYNLYMSGPERGLAFVMLAVIAPIAEEIIFRGWLYGKLRIAIPKWAAVLITSLLFGLIHWQWNVGISVFAMSLVTCTLREITGTIYAGTLVHIINNGVAFFLVYIVGTF